jgi:hydroxyethylthiazole kinase-like uncharacterized protein yjeF
LIELKKILTSAQTRLADNWTIEQEPISSIELMERASNAFVNAIEEYLNPSKSIAVVCGSGNNGGDGLAVARILMWKGFEVQPILFQISDELSADCEANSKKIDNILTVEKSADLPDLSDFDCIIDGLFGSGLNRKLEEWSGKIVDSINSSNAMVISIDIPSGMYCDTIPEGNHIVRSDMVISFQRPKLSFFLKESSQYIKSYRTVDIGLDETFIQGVSSKNFLLDNSIGKRLIPRKKYSHKGSYGHALIIVGSKGKMGAAILCGKGCLRSGVGLMTVHAPSCGLDIMQISTPEAMCSTDPDEYHFTTLPDISKYSCVGIGPGLGTAEESKEALGHLLNTSEVPIVIDADGINIISKDPTLQALIPVNTILTPHPKEFERLVGSWNGSMERLAKQLTFSLHHKCIVVLKDADTIVTDSCGNVYFNTTGNPGMATGGSGDVLTGIITGLLAQSYTSLEAALIGVYYHGLSGDAATKQKGACAVLASDIVDNLRIE